MVSLLIFFGGQIRISIDAPDDATADKAKEKRPSRREHHRQVI
jgi:hypothetical protein